MRPGGAWPEAVGTPAHVTLSVALGTSGPTKMTRVFSSKDTDVHAKAMNGWTS